MRTFDGATFVFATSRSKARLHPVERRLVRVMEALVLQEATVLLICPPKSAVEDVARAVGVDIAPYYLDRLDFIRTRSRLRKYLRRYLPVVAHSTGLDADVLVRWAAAGLPPRVVSSLYCEDRRRRPAGPLSGAVGGLLERHTLPRTDAFVVDCGELAETVVGRGVPAERVMLDPPSVDIAAAVSEAARPAPELSSAEDGAGGPPVVGYVGRLGEGRGLDVLVEAARLLAARSAGVRVIVAGEGQATGVREGGLARFLGPVASAAAVLARLDVCCFPSTSHATPTTLMEAAALGRPIVASEVPGIADLFADGREIVLVPPGDARALADAIVGLLGDPRRAKAMGERARLRTIDHYSSAASVERHLSLYRAIVRE